jgi:Cu(I)/Ag(I) efflux system membrane protein CusA/SilA
VDGFAEVEVVEQAQALLKSKIASGELVIPAGVSYKFTGSYENQVRAEKRLSVVLPLALFAIWLILYFQFKRIPETLMVFTGILFAWSGGFIMLWFYGQGWFLDFSLFDHNLRDHFQICTINLFGGMVLAVTTAFVVPSLYCGTAELSARFKSKPNPQQEPS